LTLRDAITRQGDWLFRHRSHLPLVVTPLFLVALTQADGLEAHHETLDTAWKLFCLALGLAGLGIRALVVGYAPAGCSGRNTACQRADSLTTTGLYSLVRHPLYLGNFLAMAGVVLFLEVWWFGLVCTLAFALYYERIMCAEEAFLEGKFGDRFRQWAETTPAFLPRLRGWRPPAMSFCMRSVLRREYTGAALLTLCFFLVELLGDGLAEHEWKLDPLALVAVGLAALSYVTLLTLKRTTRLLSVPGR